MDHIQGRKIKTEDLEVTGISRSGRVRKKSSKLMDFESPDEIERTYTKRQANATQSGKKLVQENIDNYSTPKKSQIQKIDNIFLKNSPSHFDLISQQDASTLSDSEYGSEYEPNATNTTESSVDDSVESDSDYDEDENDGTVGGFRRLHSKKKKLLIKDGKIIKGEKYKEAMSSLKLTSPKPINSRTSKRTITKTLLSGPLAGFQSGGITTYGSTITSTISPSSPPLSPSKSRDQQHYKVDGIKPIDVAAHLKLLGESLTIIGGRLKEHEGQIAVSGSLSVLLDSLLCALGPLVCLTHQIPELQSDCCEPEQLTSILDNVAFIMPGL